MKKIAGACGGASLLEGLVSTPTRRGWSAIACGGEKSPIGDSLYGSPPWRSFYSCASSRAALHVGSPCLRIGQPSNAPPLLLSPPGLTTRWGPPSKTRLGRCPKTPVAGCAGYGLLSGGSRKSIRTAHRIAPKVAAAHLPFPPTPFPEAGKGPGWAGNYKPRVTLSGC